MKDTAPEWSMTETPQEHANETDPKPAVRMQRPAPTWAQTVPTRPGEPIGDTAASQALAAGSSKLSWPPASRVQAGPSTRRAEDGMPDDADREPGTVPEETDIWPPDPPTEHTMPAWPPSSTVNEYRPEPSTIPAAEPIKSWPASFDSVTEPVTQPPARASEPPPPSIQAKADATVPPASTAPTIPTAPRASTAPPAATAPPAVTVPPIPTEPHVSTAPPAPSAPPAPTVPPAARAVAPATATPPAPEPELAPPAGQPDPQAAEASWTPAPIAPAQPSESSVDWPAAVPIPSWAPRIPVASTKTGDWTPAGPSTSPAHQLAAPEPTPKSPAPAARPPAQQPAAPPQAAAAQQTSSAPTATSSRGGWEVVEQKQKASPAKVVPTPEDRSYAEWFAWAKRGGAPASACHAAAQGAFEALSSGKDVATAVQWATAAMTRPPMPVSSSRQTYCAWFSLANIDLNLDQHKAHAFAAAAILALDAGADAGRAHAAGLAAAGIS
jgi:hypothetical protein